MFGGNSLRARPLFLLLVIVIAYCLSGCAADNYVQGISETEIVIGNCVATTGEYAQAGISYDAGLTAYIRRVNDEGGINGRTIRFIHYDSESDAGKALEQTKYLIDQSKVFAITGQIGDNAIKAAGQTVTDKGIPVLYMASGISELYNEKAQQNERCIFPIHAIDITDGRIIAARIQQITGAENIGVLYSDNDTGNSILKGIKIQTESRGAGQIILEQKLETRDEVRAAVLKFKNQNVQTIVAACKSDMLPEVIAALIEEDINVPVFTSYKNASKTTLANLKEEYRGASDKFSIYAGAWLVQDDEQVIDSFRSDMEAAGYSQYAGDNFAFCGWITAQILCDGLTRVGEGELTWETFIKALESEKIKIPLGGYIDFSNGKRIGTESMALYKIDAKCENWILVKSMQELDDIKGQSTGD